MSDWTTMAIRQATKKKLTEVRGAMMLIDGKDYSLDEVVDKMADSMRIQLKRLISKTADDLYESRGRNQEADSV